LFFKERIKHHVNFIFDVFDKYRHTIHQRKL
jgi:hypothetical protein